MIITKKLLLICLLLASADIFAGNNKWVDADGNVHYSDQPPPANVKAKTLRTSSDNAAPASAVAASAVAAGSAQKTIAEREAELRKAQAAKKETADKAAQEQAKKDAEKTNCSAAQQNLRALQDGMRLMELDAKGERSYLNDEQRRQRVEKAQEDVKTYCK